MPAKHPQSFHLDAGFELAPLKPLPSVTVDSNATAILVDFRLHPALTLPPETPLDEAQHTLANSHSSLLLVVDRNNHFCGVATEKSLGDQAIMRQLGLGRRRSDLQVRDLMVPRQQMLAMDYEEFCRLSVGRIISVLKNEHLPYLLIVNRDPKEIVGVISAAELAKIFGLDLDTSQRPPSFIEIFEAVMH